MATTSPPRTRLTRPFRRQLERLEDRTAPAVFWDGGPDGNGTNWLDRFNWVGDQLPTSNDDVIIGSTGTNPTITINALAHVKSVTSSRDISAFSNFGVLRIDGIASTFAGLSFANFAGLVTGATVTVNGLLYMGGGSALNGVSGAGRLVAAGGTKLEFNNGQYIGLDDGFVLETPAGANHVWTGGFFGIARGARWENAGPLSVGSAGAFAAGLSAEIAGGPFVNSGAVDVPLGADFSCEVVNSGTFTVHAGTLSLGAPTFGPTSLTGQVLGDPGSAINFVFRVDSAAGSVIRGDAVRIRQGTIAGSFEANKTTVSSNQGITHMTGPVLKLGALALIGHGGSLNVSQATFAPGATTLPSLSVVNFAGLVTDETFTVTGPFFMADAASLNGANGGGRLIAAGGSRLELSMGNYVGLDGGFVLETPAGASHTLAWGGLLLDNGARWENAGALTVGEAGNSPPGVWALADNGSFVNTGTVDMPLGAGFACDLTNSGTIAVHSGTLELGYPTYGTISLSLTGQIVGDLGTKIDFVYSVQSATGSVIRGDSVFLRSATIAGSFEANRTTATSSSYSGGTVMSGTVHRLGALTISGSNGGRLDLAQATVAPGATTLPSMSVTVHGSLRTSETFTVTGPLYMNDRASLNGANGGGRLIADGGSRMELTDGGQVGLDGGFVLETPAGAAHTLAHGGMILANGARWENAGALTLGEAGQRPSIWALADNGGFANSGTVVAANGAGVSCDVTNNGTMVVHAGTLELGYPSYGDITLTPTGQILGDPGSTIEFVFRVDSAAGSVIRGDVVRLKSPRYALAGPNSSLSRAIDGNTIHVNGTFTLDLRPSFTSSVGQQLLIVDSTGSLTGTFAGLPEGATLAVGGYEFTISYAGGDVALTTLTMPFHPTTTVLAASAASPLFGVDGLTLTATVTSIGTPTGTVRFYDGTDELGSAPLVGGAAMLVLSNTRLAAGPHPQLRAAYAGDGGFLGSEGATTVTVIAPSTVQGLAWLDFNDDGEVNFGERALHGVSITLTGVDDLGQAVTETAQTDADGVYVFVKLRPSSVAGYTLTEVQPAGLPDGQDVLGTINNVPVGSAAVNDTFSGIVIAQGGALAENYNFGERAATTGAVGSGQTATIGFWQNKHGQNLIKALNGGATATQLGAWLAATFPNMYTALGGKTNAEVAAHYKSLFAKNGQTGVAGPPKTDAQVMATVLAVYVTNQALAGTTATAYGFLVTADGVGAATFNVGGNGAAFGIANGSTMSVLDLLLAVNARSHNGLLFDLNGNGQVSSLEAAYRAMANSVFTAINEAGGV